MAYRGLVNALVSFVGVEYSVVLAAIAYGVYYFTYATRFVSTDNAYVGAETATITPLINGPVSEVLVRETQSVDAGDVLVRLDDSDAELALALEVLGKPTGAQGVEDFVWGLTLLPEFQFVE